MKRIAMLLICATCMVACDKNEYVKSPDLYNLDVRSLKGVDYKTNFTAKFHSLEGGESLDVSQIKPDTQYEVRVQSNNSAYFRIKQMDGVEIIRNPVRIYPKEGGTPEKTASFIVKTQSDLSRGILLGIVPIHIQNEVFVRERAKNFLFHTDKN